MKIELVELAKIYTDFAKLWSYLMDEEDSINQKHVRRNMTVMYPDPLEEDIIKEYAGENDYSKIYRICVRKNATEIVYVIDLCFIDGLKDKDSNPISVNLIGDEFTDVTPQKLILADRDIVLFNISSLERVYRYMSNVFTEIMKPFTDPASYIIPLMFTKLFMYTSCNQFNLKEYTKEYEYDYYMNIINEAMLDRRIIDYNIFKSNAVNLIKLYNKERE